MTLSILAALVGVFLGSLIGDWVARKIKWIDEPSVEIVTLSESSNTETLIVYLPGILANATMIPERMTTSWSRYGVVLGVNYLSPRFRPEKIVDAVARRLLLQFSGDLRLKNVVLIGSSMGGMLAYDIHQKLKDEERMRGVQVSLMPVDAPTGRKDLHRLLANTSWVVRILPFGPLWNHLSRPIMRRFLVIPPKKGEIDADVDLDWLDQQVEGARGFPLSFWRDEVMYILSHGALKADSIDASLIYIRSTKDDDTVRPEAADKWRQAMSSKSSRSFMLDAEGAKHAAYAQNPRAYEEVFPVAFRLLGV